jgi:ferrous iron transport protein B
VAAIAAIYRETTRGWALFVAAWTTGLGYAAATVFYQSAIFSRDPASSATWIGIMVAIFAIALIAMRRWADRDLSTAPLVREGA